MRSTSKFMSRTCVISKNLAFRHKLSSIPWRHLATVTTSENAEGTQGTIIPISEAKRFISECMVKIGTPLNTAEELADVLIYADYRGHYSHGMNRLDLYVKDVSSNVCDGGAVPSIVKQTVATGFVNGNNGLGPVVGNFCMQLAIQKANDAGIGWVVASDEKENPFLLDGQWTKRVTLPRIQLKRWRRIWYCP